MAAVITAFCDCLSLLEPRAHICQEFFVFLHSFDHGWDPAFAEIVFPDCWRVAWSIKAKLFFLRSAVRGTAILP